MSEVLILVVLAAHSARIHVKIDQADFMNRVGHCDIMRCSILFKKIIQSKRHGTTSGF